MNVFAKLKKCMDDRIDDWHEGRVDNSKPLHEHLGLTREQYAEWIRNPYPGWCCQKCGEPVGRLGRFLQWTWIFDIHRFQTGCDGKK